MCQYHYQQKLIFQTVYLDSCLREVWFLFSELLLTLSPTIITHIVWLRGPYHKNCTPSMSKLYSIHLNPFDVKNWFTPQLQKKVIPLIWQLETWQVLPLVSSSDTTDKINMTERQKISENHKLSDNKHNGMNHLKPR